jgi:hypothetical protein
VKSDAIYLTLDMDGAPEYMMASVLDLLGEHDIPATIFATGESQVLRGAGASIEIGLHPEIRDMYQLEESVAPLKEMYPEARCLRSHGLVSASSLLVQAWKAGITVTSNYLSLDTPQQSPLPLLYSIHEFPVTFMDDVCLLEGGPFDLESLAPSILPGAGFSVLIFHFVHIYLNAVNFVQYKSVKGNLHDKDLVDSHSQSDLHGVRDMFLALIQDEAARSRFSLFPRDVSMTTRLPGGYPV